MKLWVMEKPSQSVCQSSA